MVELMKKCLIAACLVLLVFTLSLNAQKKPKTIAKPVKTSPKKIEPPPKYGFLVEIAADKTLAIRVTGENAETPPDINSLNELISENKTLRALDFDAMRPRVQIRPALSLDLKSIIDVINAARVHKTSRVTLELPDGISLQIPNAPRDSDLINVKPNPLFLVVALRENGDLTLNNERHGNLVDTTDLVKKLTEIFQARADNGVFREGSNEVEKHVYIKVPLTARFTDLIKIAIALEMSGAEPKSLQVDDLPDFRVDASKVLIRQ